MKAILSPLIFLSLAASSHAATTFITNNSAKTLASNEGDAGVGLTTGSADDGNNNGLNGDTLGSSTALTLSTDDGGGTITFTTVAIYNNLALFMDSDSMGHGNDKWGANQNWTFTVDKTISFDAIDMFTYNETMYLQSDAWIGDADTSGTGWTFNGTTGTFSLLGSAGSDPLFDFTSAGVSDVPAGTEIFFGYTGSASGGEQMRSFTITPVPEPTAGLLGGLGALLLLCRRRGRCG